MPAYFLASLNNSDFAGQLFKSMFDIFWKYLEGQIALTGQDYEVIESVSSFKKLRRRHYLLQAGYVCRFNTFVCAGFLRYYYAGDKGQEHIMQFAPKNTGAAND